MMIECDVHQWVESETDPRQRELRQAVHTILSAIAASYFLSASMLIKGGILLAIRYRGVRYTRDIDFSIDRPFQEFDKELFLEELEKALVASINRLEYDLDCRIQSHRIQPGNLPDPSFPALALSIGYAPKGDLGRHRRLVAGQAVDTVDVDFSFNEVTLEVENITLTDGGQLRAYSFSDLVAEKFRAILQQEIRNRSRRQDIYDLYVLFEHLPNISEEEKKKILKSLIRKSESRELIVDANSLRLPGIVERSANDYDQLQSEIVGNLPGFKKAYSKLRDFYESLPWLETR